MDSNIGAATSSAEICAHFQQIASVLTGQHLRGEQHPLERPSGLHRGTDQVHPLDEKQVGPPRTLTSPQAPGRLNQRVGVARDHQLVPWRQRRSSSAAQSFGLQLMDTQVSGSRNDDEFGHHASLQVSRHTAQDLVLPSLNGSREFRFSSFACGQLLLFPIRVSVRVRPDMILAREFVPELHDHEVMRHRTIVGDPDAYFLPSRNGKYIWGERKVRHGQLDGVGWPGCRPAC